MAVIKITCPECQSVLRPAKPVPAGKTVKCPECGSRFTVSDEEPQAPPRKPKKASTDTTPAGERKPKPSANKTTPKQGAGKSRPRPTTRRSP